MVREGERVDTFERLIYGRRRQVVQFSLIIIFNVALRAQKCG